MIQVVLITRTGKAYLANGIAAFTPTAKRKEHCTKQCSCCQ